MGLAGRMVRMAHHEPAPVIGTVLVMAATATTGRGRPMFLADNNGFDRASPTGTSGTSSMPTPALDENRMPKQGLPPGIVMLPTASQPRISNQGLPKPVKSARSKRACGLPLQSERKSRRCPEGYVVSHPSIDCDGSILALSSGPGVGAGVV